jgi:hypothetical protein
MTNWNRTTTVAALSACVLAGACTGDAMDESAVESVTAALSDGFTTLHGEPVAVSAGSSDEMAVWRGCKAASGTLPASSCPSGQAEQIVGEAFGINGAPFGNSPGSHIFSSTSSVNTKSSPAVANNTDVNTWLVVWQEERPNTGSDIMGAIRTDQGLVSRAAFAIANTSDSEQAPAVTYVRNKGEWLVTYRRTHGSTTSLTSKYLDVGGATVKTVDTVASGVSTSAHKHTISASAPNSNILVTWNDNKLAFADDTNLTAGTVSTYSGATGLVGTFNEAADTFGVAWRTGTGTGTQIHTQIYPGGCTTSSCATFQNMILPVPSGGNGINLPVIAPIFTGYGVIAGALPASLKEMIIVSVDATNFIELGNYSLTPTCGGNLQSGDSLGQTGTIAAATAKNDTSAREFLIYDAFCNTSPNKNKVQMVSVSNNLDDPQNFPVSD